MIQEADEFCEKESTYVENSLLTKGLTNLAIKDDGNQFEFPRGSSTGEGGLDQREEMNRMITSFEMKNPIDLSIDPSRHTGIHMQASPTNAKCSHIAGVKGGQGRDFSQFCDDSNIVDLLMNNGEDDEGGEGGAQNNMFDEIDMGNYDEEDRQYLLIDKDTGRVYDLRNEDSLKKITSR